MRGTLAGLLSFLFIWALLLNAPVSTAEMTTPQGSLRASNHHRAETSEATAEASEAEDDEPVPSFVDEEKPAGEAAAAEGKEEEEKSEEEEKHEPAAAAAPEAEAKPQEAGAAAAAAHEEKAKPHEAEAKPHEPAKAAPPAHEEKGKPHETAAHKAVAKTHGKPWYAKKHGKAAGVSTVAVLSPSLAFVLGFVHFS